MLRNRPQIMGIEQIEQAVAALCQREHEGKDFLWEILAAYETPQASLTRLKKGDYNLSKVDGEVLWKKKVAYRYESKRDLHESISELAKNPNVKRHSIRFVVVTDLHGLLAQDTKTGDSLDIEIRELSKHFDFFLPWAGMEKARHRSENPADVKAAERMGRLYDLIVQENEFSTEAQRHELNVFLARLLFCFFAEDTGIFAPDQFTNAVASHTAESGEDLQSYLSRLFDVLNTEDRSKYPRFLQDFPYVNGGLFAQKIKVPRFSSKSRKMIIDAGDLNWKAINPDILGSMMQAVVHGEKRDGLGMHYTSVTNILKVLDPLFLDELREQLDAAGESKPKLQKLLDRIYNMRVFDPASGSGNFLVIAYKELARIEIEALRRIHGKQLTARFMSRLVTSQFYGIEIDDFAHETAKLSLWLAEHQMNVEFKEVFGTTRPTLPLKDGGKVVRGNANSLSWESLLEKTPQGIELQIVGNPPYLGAKELDEQQRAESAAVLSDLGNALRLDYVGCWFKKAVDIVASHESASCAFVSTNSVCQGEQVSLLWPYVFKKKCEISFAHQAFEWSNHARGNAGVTCVIVGLRPVGKTTQKKLYSESSVRVVSNISPYLIEADNTVMAQRRSSISGFPTMVLGSSGFDGGHLVMSAQEKDGILAQAPGAERFIRKFMSGEDFLKGAPRYCLWIQDEEVEEALLIDAIRERVAKCRKFRQQGGRDAQKAAAVPHRFFYRTHEDTDAVVFPKTTSGRRHYVPAGYASKDTVFSNANFVVYGAQPWILGVLSSRMHCVWMSITSARHRTDYRYSVNLTYNTMPFPAISAHEKERLGELALRILDVREQFPERTLADLYDPDHMPPELRKSHEEVDRLVESFYSKKEFVDDEERLRVLFKAYRAAAQKGGNHA